MSVMRFEETYHAFNANGRPMPYTIVKNGSGYLIVDLEPGVVPPIGQLGFPDLPSAQNAAITHAQTYRASRLSQQL
jgi:hypothetical protein